MTSRCLVLVKYGEVDERVVTVLDRTLVLAVDGDALGDGGGVALLLLLLYHGVVDQVGLLGGRPPGETGPSW